MFISASTKHKISVITALIQNNIKHIAIPIFRYIIRYSSLLNFFLFDDSFSRKLRDIFFRVFICFLASTKMNEFEITNTRNPKITVTTTPVLAICNIFSGSSVQYTAITTMSYTVLITQTNTTEK